MDLAVTLEVDGKVKKRAAIISAIVVIVIIVVSTFAAIEIYSSSSTVTATKKPFYVGVTYCGDNVTEAEQLVDRVKSYTNLFVIQSGTLMDDSSALDQVCSYAVNAGLNIIVFFANNVPTINVTSFVNSAQASWGSHFLGIYADDETGGKMLDSTIQLFSNNGSPDNGSMSKQAGGYIILNYQIPGSSIAANNPSSVNSTLQVYPSGEILMESSYLPVNETVGTVSNVTVTSSSDTTYYPNGTISYRPSYSYFYSNMTEINTSFTALSYEPDGTVLNQTGQAATNGPDGNLIIENTEQVLTSGLTGMPIQSIVQVVTNPGNISHFKPYQEVWDLYPLQNYSEAANVFQSTVQYNLNSIYDGSGVQFFTTDYGLDWWDYQGGYDVVLGELGWNQSVTQDIALVRGAADMQNKSWGTMIEWQSLSPITLQSENQMYNNMKQSYESGAEYVVVYNYSPNNNGTGLLGNPQFSAMQSFWKNVVENPHETNNAEGQDALVLPQDYGWGMRNPNDNIWGLWPADNSSQQVWASLQWALAKYGSKLDIVYQDPAYPVEGRYQHVIYWNQTV